MLNKEKKKAKRGGGGGSSSNTKMRDKRTKILYSKSITKD